MKKLRLNTDELSIEPFEVEAAQEEGGTVMGADASSPRNCTGPDVSCGYPYTCGGTSCDSGYPVCYLCPSVT